MSKTGCIISHEGIEFLWVNTWYKWIRYKFNSDGTVKINAVPINIYEQQGNIVVYTLSDRSDMTGYVILEYIKTTD